MNHNEYSKELDKGVGEIISNNYNIDNVVDKVYMGVVDTIYDACIPVDKNEYVPRELEYILLSTPGNINIGGCGLKIVSNVIEQNRLVHDLYVIYHDENGLQRFIHRTSNHLSTLDKLDFELTLMIDSFMDVLDCERSEAIKFIAKIKYDLRKVFSNHKLANNFKIHMDLVKWGPEWNRVQ